MHSVSKIDEAAAQTPKLYGSHSTGFRRATYVDHRVGSVHMGVGVCFLEPMGAISPHVHSFEESFYILQGNPTVQIGGKSYTLGPGHFGLISTGVPHAWHNASDGRVRWLEMQAPQPRPAEYGKDTFFVSVDGAGQGTAAPDPRDPADKLLGHFDEAQLPRPGALRKWKVSTRPPVWRSRCLWTGRLARSINRCF